jgi:hypothetical protein
MTSRIVADAAKAAGRVRDAGQLRTFRHAVDGFVHVLASVPDESAGAVSAEGVRTLETLGQDVIDRIEERVDDISSAGDAQELVSDVYEIRRLLEAAGRWRQHYAIARHV